MSKTWRARCDRAMDRFESLGFEFAAAAPDSSRYLGQAPHDKVGFLDIATRPTTEVSFLFSGDRSSAHRFWADQCLIALADVLDVDFLPWLQRAESARGLASGWTASHRLPSARVTLRFDPIDIMLLRIRPKGVARPKPRSLALDVRSRPTER